MCEYDNESIENLFTNNKRERHQGMNEEQRVGTSSVTGITSPANDSMRCSLFYSIYLSCLIGRRFMLAFLPFLLAFRASKYIVDTLVDSTFAEALQGMKHLHII